MQFLPAVTDFAIDNEKPNNVVRRRDRCHVDSVKNLIRVNNSLENFAVVCKGDKLAVVASVATLVRYYNLGSVVPN